jgi:hypothetical protein
MGPEFAFDREDADLLGIGVRIQNPVHLEREVDADDGRHVFLAPRQHHEQDGQPNDEQARQARNKTAQAPRIQRRRYTLHGTASLSPSDGTNGSWSARWRVKTSR